MSARVVRKPSGERRAEKQLRKSPERRLGRPPKGGGGGGAPRARSRSASSSTSSSRLRTRSEMACPARGVSCSSSRPGVPTSTCDPLRSAAASASVGPEPPISSACLKRVCAENSRAISPICGTGGGGWRELRAQGSGRACRHAALSAWRTCEASSRVGAMTRAPTSSGSQSVSDDPSS